MFMHTFTLEGMGLLLSLIVAIGSQCTQISNPHVVHLRQIQLFFVNYISVKIEKPSSLTLEAT